jgi:hypothetical protein
MEKRFGTYMVITIQLAALLALQLTMVAPQVARLFPAIAAGDLGECHCSAECRCSLESRRNGTCCCKQAKKLKLKMHCRSASAKTGPVSLRTCPCNGASHITFVSPDNPVYLGFFVEPPSHDPHPGLGLGMREPRQPRDNDPDPPDPPPRLSLFS